MSDYERARKIVRAAAAQVKDRSTRAWLLADERGTFEKMAKEYLDRTAERAKELGMSASAIDEEIATIIGFNAMAAQLQNLKKSTGKRKR